MLTSLSTKLVEVIGDGRTGAQALWGVSRGASARRTSSPPILLDILACVFVLIIGCINQFHPGTKLLRLSPCRPFELLVLVIFVGHGSKRFAFYPEGGVQRWGMRMHTRVPYSSS